MSGQNNYTVGYTHDDQKLPYPYQVDLPEPENTLERFRAAQQWEVFIRGCPYASRQLEQAWERAALEAAYLLVKEHLSELTPLPPMQE